MTINQLIKELQSFKEDFGNKQVFTWGGDCYCPIVEIRDEEQLGKVICALNCDITYVEKVFPNVWKFED